MMISRFCFTLRLIFCVMVLSFPLSGSLFAQEDFYAGKTIRLVVSGGGAYEAFARLFARYLPAYIPGKPTFVVQEMPGGGGMRAASFLYNIAPRDGTVLGAVHGSVITAPLLSPGVADFEVNKFGWIGNATRDVYIGYVNKTSSVLSLEEAKTRQVIMGGTSLGSNGIDMAIIGRDLFGLKFKIISGYKTSLDTKLAMDRSEIDGTAGSTLGSLRTSGMLDNGAVKIIFQHGFAKHPDLPDVPLFSDLAKTDQEREMLNVMLARGEFAKPYLAPPGLPPQRLELLRTAFMRTTQDPGFLADVNKQKLEYDQPTSGEEFAQLIAKVLKTPQSTIDSLNKLLASYNDGTK
jgi:tripartite-type tricarboxylate transporter receptor subunit TctC